MNEEGMSAGLDEVRAQIDRVDREIVRLMAERSGLVQQAARFKSSAADVEAPARVEAVIAKVRAIASENQLSPEVAEAAYRTMIDCFIKQEKDDFDKLTSQG